MRRALVVFASPLLVLAACVAGAPRYELGGASYDASTAQAVYAATIVERTRGAQLDHPMRVLRAPMPDYPSGLLDAAVAGRVVIRFTVEGTGEVGNITVVETADPLLSDVAVDAVRRWRFAPVTREGRPHPVVLEIPFIFVAR